MSIIRDRYLLETLNYEFRVFKYEDKWVCFFPDLPGCSSVGDSIEEAIAESKDAQLSWLGSYFKEHGRYPEPTGLGAKDYSGRILLRTSTSMHRDLVLLAEAEKISLNQLCCQLLANGLGRKSYIDIDKHPVNTTNNQVVYQLGENEQSHQESHD